MLKLSPALTSTVVLAALLVPAAAYPARPALPLPAPAIEADVDSAAAGSPLSWLEPAVLAAEKAAARRQIETAEDSVAVAARAGVAGADLAPASAAIATLKVRLAASRRSLQARAVGDQARGLEGEVRELARVQTDEQQTLVATARDLAGKDPVELARQAAFNVASARNETVVATFLGSPPPAWLNDRLERFGRQAAANPALADAGTSLYRSRIHDAFLKALPDKVIVVSIQDQHLSAFEAGKPVLETPVTTGRPELPTDVGPMQVLRKDSPWKMHSPWPKGSAYFYPDEMVRKVIWFTNTGEGFHDAPWRSAFGPGSNLNDGSHGCVNLPDAAADRLFGWADIGTPVIVYPGDGSAPAAQLAQRSVDQHGDPLDGARGA